MYQMDYQLRVPWPGSPSGYYYWTNSWILSATTDASAITRGNQVTHFIDELHLDVVETMVRTFKRAPGRDGVYFTQSQGPAPCNYPSGSAGYNLLWCVRIDFLASGKIVAYKRLRMPVRNDQVSQGKVDPLLIADIAAGLDPLIGFGSLGSIQGLVVDDYRISPDIRMWQLRHGTERRERVVIA